MPFVMVATASALVICRLRNRIFSAIEPEPSIARMMAVRWVRVMLCVYMLRRMFFYFRPRTE